MTPEIPRPPLKGKKALVVGVANEHSIAYGCAAVFHELEADLAITYLNEKAKPYVEPLARKLDASILMPLDAWVAALRVLKIRGRKECTRAHEMKSSLMNEWLGKGRTCSDSGAGGNLGPRRGNTSAAPPIAQTWSSGYGYTNARAAGRFPWQWTTDSTESTHSASMRCGGAEALV